MSRKKKNAIAVNAGVPVAAPELTLDQRTMMANTMAEAALGVFQIAATDLEDAATDLEQVALEAGMEMDRMRGIQWDAEEGAEERRVQAAAIRGILTGGKL